MVREQLLRNDVLTLDEHLTLENLIDTDWKTKPIRPWEEVYEELCADLGKHYGLNDIRDAQ